MADSAISKRLKLSMTSDDVIDRISSLPDCLLFYILSLMPTKYAVKTSILSTRWKFLWTYIINLDFDDVSCKGSVNRRRFKRFVYRVLLLLKPSNMQKFRLHYRLTDSDSGCLLHINSWIIAAIDRDVEEIDLKVYGLEPALDHEFLRVEYELTCMLFNSNTLVVLKLDGQFSVELSSYNVSLPSLKIFHSIDVIYTDSESICKLFSGCPILEDVFIKRSYLNDGALNFKVSCCSLKKLKICFDDMTFRGILEINAPALEYLDLTDSTSSEISLMNMVSLVEAKIDACIWGRTAYDCDDVLHKFLNGLSNAKFLSLSCRTMEALSFASHQSVFPKFDNLKRLNVTFTSKSREWKPLLGLLANSVNLEELISLSYGV